VSDRPLRIGVLAVQGDFAAHIEMLESLGAATSEVRDPADLEGLDGVVLPGGESTTISKGMARDGLDRALTEAFRGGLPVFGTCAGMIVADRAHLGLGDYLCERNAFGRQLDSFERDIEVEGAGPDPVRAVFIRAPWVADLREGVEVLAEVEEHPVALRSGNLLAAAFHSELTDDSRMHAMFMAMTTASRKAGRER